MGIHFLNIRSLLLVASGALGFLAATEIKSLPRARPVAVGAAKEMYAFKEWVASKVEKAKENVEDILAEAKHAYHKEAEVKHEEEERREEVGAETEPEGK